MNPKSKKFISLFLIFSLTMLSMNLYAKERRGVNLIVTKKDGLLIKGELITVKPNSLLLLNTEGKDESIDIAEIEVIRIVKRSKFLKGARPGALVGVTAGILTGMKIYQEEDPGINYVTFFLMPLIKTANAFAPVIYGMVYMTYGALIGGIVGVAVGDKTIEIEGKSDLEIRETLDKLRKKARIRDYK